MLLTLVLVGTGVFIGFFLDKSRYRLRLADLKPPRNGPYQPFLKGYTGPTCTADALAMHERGVCHECDWERSHRPPYLQAVVKRYDS